MEHGNHKWVRRAVLQESVDPPLKPAAKRELPTEHLVLGKKQKKTPYRDPQQRQSNGVPLSHDIYLVSDAQ
jgi:hypothetical protein